MTLAEVLQRLEDLETRRLSLVMQAEQVALEKRALSRQVYDAATVPADGESHKRFAVAGVIYVATPTDVRRDDHVEQLGMDLAVGEP